MTSSDTRDVGWTTITLNTSFPILFHRHLHLRTISPFVQSLASLNTYTTSFTSSCIPSPSPTQHRAIVASARRRAASSDHPVTNPERIHAVPSPVSHTSDARPRFSSASSLVVSKTSIRHHVTSPSTSTPQHRTDHTEDISACEQRTAGGSRVSRMGLGQAWDTSE